MQTLLFVSFGVGSGFIFLSFVFGEILGLIDINAELDADFGNSLSLLKPHFIAVFLVVFGGVGLLLLDRISLPIVLSCAIFLGLAAAYAIFRLVYVPLHKMQSYAVEKQRLIGCSARVTEKIPQGGYGKITYHADGNTFTSPAKSEDGDEIARKTNVVIAYIDKNTYYVRKLP